MEKLQNEQKKQFIEACAKELAARLLAKVIKNTHPGIYPESTGKKGGTLRRGWTTQQSNGFEIKQVGDAYVIELVNPVEYASYVEYGHRTRDHKGWVQGKFILTKAEAEIEADAPRILENKLKKYLADILK